MLHIQSSFAGTAAHASRVQLPTNYEADQPLILVADDEIALTGEIADYLRRYGMRVIEANSFDETITVLQEHAVNAILLDQRFGSVDAMQLLPHLRSLTDVPILMHTGNREEMDRVVCLELGADDFLMKPVSGRELVARIRAHLRRPATRQEMMPRPQPSRLAPRPAAPAPQAVVPVAAPAPAPARQGWRIVQAERRVYRPDGTPVRLTIAEFDTLAALAETPGETRTRDALTKAVFRREWRPGDRAVDNAILHLRQKLQDDLGEHCIVTVRQLGYIFAGFPQA